jgi:hypothetical protein
VAVKGRIVRACGLMSVPVLINVGSQFFFFWRVRDFGSHLYGAWKDKDTESTQKRNKEGLV